MKAKLLNDEREKTYAVIFDTGDEVMQGLLSFAREHRLAGSHLTAIGAFRDVTLGYFDWQTKEYRKIPIQEQVEVAHGFGAQFKHPTGHGVGFAAISHNALPRLHPKSEDVLEVGMVFNVEPAVYVEGFGGLRHCDVVTVTERGAEVLTPFQCDPDELILAEEPAAAGAAH